MDLNRSGYFRPFGPVVEKEMANRPYILVYKRTLYIHLPFGIGKPSILTLRYRGRFHSIYQNRHRARFVEAKSGFKARSVSKKAESDSPVATIPTEWWSMVYSPGSDHICHHLGKPEHHLQKKYLAKRIC